MMYRSSGALALTATLFAVVLSAPADGRAETPDALTRAALADPISTSKSGTMQFKVSATIRDSLMVEYVSPMVLETVDSGNGKFALSLVSGDNTGGRTNSARHGPARAASMEVQGMPNQTFAISIDQSTEFRSGLYVATFSHNAGQTPHIGPDGDIEFNIGAALKLARTAANYSYSGALDVIVSHN